MSAKNDKRVLDEQDGHDPFANVLIATDRNRWFFLAIILAVVIGFLTWDNISLRRDRSDIDMAWVRVYPDGTWDISVNDSQHRPEFFITTANSLLAKFIAARYSINPHTISHDYGVASLFMATDLQNQFTQKEPAGFNAVDRAAEVIDCATRCESIDIKIRDFDHYDSLESAIDTGVIYKSSVYIEEISTLDGRVQDPSEKSIIAIEWRILDKQSLLNKYPDMRGSKKEFADYLNKNPIGMEVMKYEKLVDPTESISTASRNTGG